MVFYFLHGLRALKRSLQASEVRLLALAIVLAVAAISSVSLLSFRVGAALQIQANQTMGGDLVLNSGRPIPESFINKAQELELKHTETTEFPSMVSSDNAIHLASIKAVENNYPLRNHLQIYSKNNQDIQLINNGPKPSTVWVDEQLLQQLNLKINDSLQVGDIELRIDSIIAYEPDRSMQLMNIAPRVMMHSSDLDATGLIGVGSRVNYSLLTAGEQKNINHYEVWLEENLENGQKINTVETSRPELQKALDRAHYFLSLISLLTVTLSALAIAMASRHYYLRNQQSIAVMRCLGASRSLISSSIWVQFSLLAIGASIAGLLIAYLVQNILGDLVANWLDINLPIGSFMPYIQGAFAGYLLLLGFAMPVLLNLRNIPPIVILRSSDNKIKLNHLLSLLIAVLVYAAIVFMIAQNITLALILFFGFVLVFLLFFVCAYLLVLFIQKISQNFKQANFLRFSIRSIARRKALAAVHLIAIGIGLTILLLLSIMRTDLINAWQRTVAPDAPNMFLINIQQQQIGPLENYLIDNGFKDVEFHPLVRARLTAINDKPIDLEQFKDERAKSIVTRELNLSYTDSLPISNKITSGQWVDHIKNQISLEQDFAQSLGVAIGDYLEFDFSGTKTNVKITSLRQVKWDSFDVNFFALLSNNALEQAQASYLTSLHFGDDTQQVIKNLRQQFPNVTMFDIRVILKQVTSILNQVITAIQVLFIFALLAGIIVLVAALFGTKAQRMHEMVIMRTLGASTKQLAFFLRTELIILGAIAGLLASASAQLIAWYLASYVFEFGLELSLWPWIAGIISGVLLSWLSGVIALKGVVHSAPINVLRQVA